jgi:hypothetical protein
LPVESGDFSAVFLGCLPPAILLSFLLLFSNASSLMYFVAVDFATQFGDNMGREEGRYCSYQKGRESKSKVRSAPHAIVGSYRLLLVCPLFILAAVSTS